MGRLPIIVLALMLAVTMPARSDAASAEGAVVAWNTMPEGDLPRHFRATDIKALYARLSRTPAGALPGDLPGDLIVFAADSVVYDGARSQYRVELPQHCNKYVHYPTDMLVQQSDDAVETTRPAGPDGPEERHQDRWYLAITNGCRLDLPAANPSYVGNFDYDVVFAGQACPCGTDDMQAVYLVRLRAPFIDRRSYSRPPEPGSAYRLQVDQRFVFGDLVGLMVVDRGSGKVLLRLETGGS